ncbi:glycosyltransferase [Patescibacteria group bacterium]|nr:MAG: glycosyltransferase [Patescibacteria group bacterium]
MRIAMIGQKGVPMGEQGGGIEKHVEELSARLVSRGHEVLVYVRPWYPGSNRSSWRGITLIRAWSWHTKNFDTITHAFFSSLDVCRRNADIIHYHGVGPSTLAWIPRLFARHATVVVTFHSQDRYHRKWGILARGYLTFGEWTAVRWAHATIAVSQALQGIIEARFKKKAVYIPNGVSLLPAPGPEALAEFGLKSGGYLLVVARLVRHKGIHTLIEAYQGLTTDKKLVIVGAPSFTKEYQSFLLGMAHGNPDILFLGYQGGRTLQALFAHAHVYVSPSESEGLSISTLEAMSYGLPVLVSDIPENKEAVDGCGYFFRSGDALDLRVRLKELLPDEPRLREMGQCGKAFIRAHFDWDAIAAKTDALYQRLRG